MRKVIVLPYDPAWKDQFEEGALQIKAVLGDQCTDIHHIGSTAVLGLAAKPVIDILPVVKDIKAIDFFNDKLAELGYIAKGENGLPGRRYFQKGGDERTHHVHVYQEGNVEIRRHLAFRNYLRDHPQVAGNYGALKKGLAFEYPWDIENYIEGKSEFVSEIEKKAMEEL